MTSVLRKNFDRIRNAGELPMAAKSRRLYAVMEMVDVKKVPIDTRNTQGESTVMIAAGEGDFQIFSFAMEKNAELNFVATDGTTALDRAIALVARQKASTKALHDAYPPGTENKLGGDSCKGQNIYDSLRAAGAKTAQELAEASRPAAAPKAAAR